MEPHVAHAAAQFGIDAATLASAVFVDLQVDMADSVKTWIRVGIRAGSRSISTCYVT